MTNNKTGSQYEFRKSFKKYDLVIDKGRIFTSIVVIIAIIGFMFFMFYLAGVIG